MPRPRRKENAGLPARWRRYHGAFYYSVPPGLEHLWGGKKQFRLGTTLADAHRAFAERVTPVPGEIAAIAQALDRYVIEVLPGKAAKTQIENHRAIRRLRAVFGHLGLSEIEPQHCYKYIARSSTRGVGRKDIALLSHLFTKLVEWGEIKAHPFLGQLRIEDAGYKRTRYVEDWEIVEALALPSRRKAGSVLAMQAAIRLIMLTPLRRKDLLELRPADFTDEGIPVATSKTGKPVVYEWTPELREAVRIALAARPVDIAPTLFCTREGRGYYQADKGDAPGWDSMWQRFMRRVLAETKVSVAFTEHDVRAKCGSDAESLERARALLAHVNTSATPIYRRRPERVRPLR